MNKQSLFTIFMWLLGHVLILALYFKLAYAFPIPFVIGALGVGNLYAHYRLSFYFASKLS